MMRVFCWLLISALFNNAAGFKATASESGFASLVQQVGGVPFLAPQLDFGNFVEALKAQPNVSVQQVTAWQQQLAKLTPKGACEEIAFHAMAFQLGLIKQRQLLKAELSQSQTYQGDFSSFHNGQKWYRHWLHSWLLEEVSIQQLKDMAWQELDASFQAYSNSKQLPAPSALQDYKAEQHGEIVKAFREREQKVTLKLEGIIGLTQEISQVNIEPSGLPESFPAPGIYTPQNNTFLYHPQNGQIKGKHMDWLFLHEALPGHHLQFEVAQIQPLCPAPRFMPTPYISAEGWAAYVETLGQQFGLLNHPESQAYAYEWRVLRALRVLIDIGLHHDNWTENTARNLWNKYLPALPEIREREIARIKQWPVQVITYVYGKHLIEKAMAAYEREHRAASTFPQLRNLVLRLSNQPPVALDHLSEFITLEAHP